MSAQHSPLPWRVWIYTSDSNGAVIEDATGTLRLETKGGNDDDNADFVVRACNNHEALLAALKAIQSQCAGHADEFSARVWKTAQDAIAAAGAK